MHKYNIYIFYIIAYSEYPELLEMCDETVMKSETGATQGCPLAMMLFAYAFSKVFEKLRDILEPEEANTDPAHKQLQMMQPLLVRRIKLFLCICTCKKLQMMIST